MSIASADGRGHVAVLMPAALAVGGSLGPLIAGALLAGGQGYAPLYAFFGAAAIGLAAFLVLGAPGVERPGLGLRVGAWPRPTLARGAIFVTPLR